MSEEVLLKEIEGLKRWIDDLHSGMYVNCVYCGYRYGPEEDTPVAFAEILKQHIEVCPKHPMSQLKKENEDLRRWLDAAVQALLSYQYGNSSPDLAEEVLKALRDRKP